MNSTNNYKMWWETLADTSTPPSTMEKASQIVIDGRLRIMPAYSRLTDKTLELVDVYIYYLSFVERNTQQLKELSIQREFYTGVHLDYQWSQYFYLEISFESNLVGYLKKISPNITKLLGYQRHHLIDEPMSELIPGFYRSQHEETVKEVFANGSGLESITREILVQGNNREYHEARLQLSLWSDSNSICFRGSLRFPVIEEQRMLIVFDEASGKLLGGSEAINSNIYCDVETLTSVSVTEIMKRLT